MGRRILRKPEVLGRVGVSDVSIWRWERAGQFPRRVSLGGNSVGWFEDEIEAWMDDRAAEREAVAA